MKKISLLLALCLLALSVCGLSGCKREQGVYQLFAVAETDGEIDLALMEEYMRSVNENYDVLKGNCPEILSEIINITPEELKGVCSIYRFSFEHGHAFCGETYLVYKGNVYHLGAGLGGYGVSEFAYIQDPNQHVLYYIYSWGSGIHRSEIGMFDFETKEIKRYAPENFIQVDIGFFLSNDGKTLGFCSADFSFDDKRWVNIRIEKGKMLYRNIELLEFKTINK